MSDMWNKIEDLKSQINVLSHDIARVVNQTSTSHYSKCILIFGAYTNGNMGDYIQPVSVIAHLRSIDPNICVYTSGTEYGKGPYNKIITNQEHHFGSLLCDSHSADIVNKFGAFLIGGGGLLTVPHRPLVCPEFSKSLRSDLPVIFFGIGSENQVSVNHAEPLLKLATFISARDNSSTLVIQDVLRANKIDKTVYKMVDPVLSDRKSFGTAGYGIVSSEWKSSTSLCYVLPGDCYDHKNSSDGSKFSGHGWIARILNPNDVLINVFPKYSQKIMSYYPNHTIHDIIEPKEYIATINKCRAVISMRLHGSILGLHSSVPTIPMSTALSGKVYSLVHTVLDFPDSFILLKSTVTMSVMHRHVNYVVNEYLTNGRREKVWAKLDALFNDTHNLVREHIKMLLPISQSQTFETSHPISNSRDRF